VLLAMKHKMLPATLHFDRANDLIDFDETPFAVCHERLAWHADGPRRAGVSSFGLGGANAHVVLEEAPAARPVEASRGPALLVLSAATATALAALVAAFAASLKRSPDLRLVDVCQTALVGRAHFRHRAAIVASTMLDLVRKIESFGATSSASAAVDAFCGEIDDDLDASVSVPCVLYRGRDAASASAALRQHAMRYVTGLATSEEATPPPFTRVPLPTYPFERVRCWPDGASGAGAARSTSDAVPRSVPESASTHDAAPPSRSHVAELRRSSHPLLGVRRAER
jgi:acyl transferase domain-containing protein